MLGIFTALHSVHAQSAIIPPCALEPGESKDYCSDINALILLGVNIAQFIFSISGAVAFAMFVYGGFTMILSFGNSERVNKGRGILVAAVVGLIISLSAYLLIDFILDAFQISTDFRQI